MKEDVRKFTTETQDQLRNQAIRLRKQGKTHKEIAEIVGVHGETRLGGGGRNMRRADSKG